MVKTLSVKTLVSQQHQKSQKIDSCIDAIIVELYQQRSDVNVEVFGCLKVIVHVRLHPADTLVTSLKSKHGFENALVILISTNCATRLLHQQP